MQRMTIRHALLKVDVGKQLPRPHRYRPARRVPPTETLNPATTFPRNDDLESYTSR